MVKFGGEIGTLYQMLKNAFKKHPLQNRTNVQIKGGGGQRPFEQCSKKLHFFERMASLSQLKKIYFFKNLVVKEAAASWCPGRMSAMEGINCGAQAIALSVNCTFGKLHKLQRINLQQTNQLIHCKFNTRSTKIKGAQCK